VPFPNLSEKFRNNNTGSRTPADCLRTETETVLGKAGTAVEKYSEIAIIYVIPVYTPVQYMLN
jgi:hypothetical protein